MITRAMQKNLETRDVGFWKTDHGRIEKSRIQKRIEKELDALLWLTLKYPDVFLYENCYRSYRQMRLRKLMAVVCALQGKHVEVELTKPIDKKADRHCKKCGRIPYKPLCSNGQCSTCNQKEFFESVKAKAKQ